ncbi:hypothetical protein BLNAU_3259 [Blattamonas nauphoetae]|uniref:Uncharacterized protein n=1 Tax=Blattamonas nauphoetae TaxID=2049346 RepID=A0ABQ9YDK4_9EUKA|nr:hypothetical protein BLNAU_3259 [Blattamonas nauphoetae]
MIPPEYSPFLNWNPTILLTADSVPPTEHRHLSYLQYFVQPNWIQLPKPHWTVCGFDGSSVVLLPSINFKGCSHIHSHLSAMEFSTNPPGPRLRQTPSQNPFHTSLAGSFYD